MRSSIASCSFPESNRRSFSILSTANLLQGMNNVLRTYPFAIIIPIRIKENLLFANISKVQRFDDQSIIMHFHKITIRREMIPPLLGQGDLSALGAFQNFFGHGIKSKKV